MKTEKSILSRKPALSILMVPYLVAVCVSLIWFMPEKDHGVGGMILKCTPILLLMVHLLVVEEPRDESAIVLIALCFSVLGDAMLVWPKDYFLLGVLFFGVAQGLYVLAFGFRVVSMVIGGALYGTNVLVMSAVVPSFPGVALKVAVPFYSFLIATMVWRAIDRARLPQKVLKRERRLCTVIGAISFAISDLSIALFQVGQLLPPMAAQTIILSTYYFAQLLIVLGASPRIFTTTDDPPQTSLKKVL